MLIINLITDRYYLLPVNNNRVIQVTYIIIQLTHVCRIMMESIDLGWTLPEVFRVEIDYCHGHVIAEHTAHVRR